MKNYKVLIIKTGALGDVLRTTVILPAIKEKWPQSRIVWFTQEKAYPLISGNKYIDEIVFFTSLDKGMFKEEEVKSVLTQRFDIVVSLEEFEAACQMALEVDDEIIGTYFDFQERKVKYTPSSRNWFDMSLISLFGKDYADELKRKNRMTHPEHMLKMLGVGFDPKRYRPQIVLNDAEKKFGREFMKKNGIDKGLVIGLNTDAGDKWQTKKLSIDKTALLAEKLAEDLGANLVMLSESNQRNREIIEKSKVKIIDAGRCDLRRFMAIVRECDLVLTGDSLVLHIAIGLNKKFVSFFGPTSEAEIETYGLGKKIFSQDNYHCCYCSTCRYGISCLERIDNGIFIQAVQKVLNL